MSGLDRSSCGKRAHSPYSPERHYENRRKIYREERVNKFHRTNDSSLIRRKSASRSPETRHMHREEISHKTYRRSRSPSKKTSMSHCRSQREHSPNTSVNFDSSHSPRRRAETQTSELSGYSMGYNERLCNSQSEIMKENDVNSTRSNFGFDINNEKSSVINQDQSRLKSSPHKNLQSGRCPFQKSNISSDLSSSKDIKIRKKGTGSQCESNVQDKNYESYSKTFKSNKNLENYCDIDQNNPLPMEPNKKISHKRPNIDTELDNQDHSGTEPNVSSSPLKHTKEVASNPDCTSIDGTSKGDNVNNNVEEEITEESRLIQMNPSLREFHVLDDLEESEHESEAQQSNSSEYESGADEEVPLEDLDAMLEEGLPDKFKDANKNKEQTIRLKRKVVLEEIGHDHFDLLPEGWIQIMHSSGMPVYLHQKSRVCTMARPYYLGPGSSRNHKIPLSAIPCLQYRRALEVERKNKEEKEKLSVQNQNQPELQLMAARIETSEENEASQSLEATDLREYCKKIFNFKTITLIPFKSWADRRKYVRMTKDLKKRQRPSLPGGTKLLKFPTQNPDGTNSRSKGEWIINPNGKSYVCILHEYVQHALRKHPKYQFKELENPATPYSATVFIGDMQYSVGVGASKKQAKVEAAKAALEVLIPEMKDKIERDSQFGMRSGIARRSQNSDISIFDQIKVEDPRVAEFCAKTTEPPPYAILLTCLSRNMGLGDIKVHYEMNSKKHKEDEFTMTVGNHTATVVCKNKRDGKQRAAQAILQALHPNITHWGSLLRMYGNRSIKNVKEKKQEEQEITGLQSKASLNQPNFAILEKLKTEMLKLKEKREAVKAKGKFTPPENIILPSLSSTDLNKVNLS